MKEGTETISLKIHCNLSRISIKSDSVKPKNFKKIIMCLLKILGFNFHNLKVEQFL